MRFRPFVPLGLLGAVTVLAWGLWVGAPARPAEPSAGLQVQTPPARVARAPSTGGAHSAARFPEPRGRPRDQERTEHAVPRPPGPVDPDPDTDPAVPDPGPAAAEDLGIHLPDPNRILELPPVLQNADVGEQRAYFEQLAAYHENILERAEAQLAEAADTDEGQGYRERIVLYMRHAEQQLALLRGRLERLSE